MLRNLGLVLGVMLALAGPAAAAEVDQAALGRLEQRIRSGEIKGVHSLILMQGKETLAEWYFTGRDEKRGRALGEVTFGPETLHDVRSVTKSIVGLLVGVAVSDGAIKSLDAPAVSYFPEYGDLQTPERRRVTLRHLLSMTSGLHWDESTYPYSDPRNSEIAMDMAKDPYRYVLSQPFDAEPGARFKYSGGDVAVMAAILARATKQPLEAYAQAKLFGPLGIRDVEWLKDARGVPFAASGLRMTPRDMATVGRMVAQDGRWNGRQVIPARWIAESTTRHADVAPERCGLGYGYFWWLYPACEARPPAPTASAIGNGGQRIMVVKSRDLVLVFTAGNYNSRQQGETTDALVDGVMRAVNP